MPSNDDKLDEALEETFPASDPPANTVETGIDLGEIESAQSSEVVVPDAYTHSLPLASWLFLKGSESIWVERPHGLSMLVAGPGAVRDERDFADEDSLQAYQVALAERLTEGGWFLWGVDRERRQVRDRRGAQRSTPDRRHAAVRAR
jgi:hypothetical protein